MNVEIINFPETKVTVSELHGSLTFENESIMRLVQWRKENKLAPSNIHRCYGIYYNESNTVSSAGYHVEQTPKFGLSYKI